MQATDTASASRKVFMQATRGSRFVVTSVWLMMALRAMHVNGQAKEECDLRFQAATRSNTECLVIFLLLLAVVRQALHEDGATLIPIFCTMPLELDAISLQLPHEVLYGGLNALP